jgi:hypothetical protein
VACLGELSTSPKEIRKVPTAVPIPLVRARLFCPRRCPRLPSVLGGPRTRRSAARPSFPRKRAPHADATSTKAPLPPTVQR